MFRRAVGVGVFPRALQAAVLCVVTVVMMGAGGQSRFDRLGHTLMCVCGCNQILLECNHFGCTDSSRMIGELRDQVAGGGGDSAVQNWFVAKYGAIVLAAPTRGGFDNVAWIMPIAVFVLATAGTAVVVWLWRKRWVRMAGAAPGFAGGMGDFAAPGGALPEDTAMRDRIRRETEF